MVKGKPFKKDGKWLVVRECDGCGDVKEVSTGAAKTRRGRGLATNQTCVRSTEVGFHPLIGFWHDYRNKDAAYN